MDRIGILIELLGDQAAMSTLRQFKSMIDDINHSKITTKIDLISNQRDLANITRRIADLRNTIGNADVFGLNKKQIADARRELAQLIDQRNDLIEKGKNMRLDVQVDNEALRLLNDQLQQARDNASAAAEAIQSIGNMAAGALNGIAAFSEGIGKAFSGMSDIFNSDILQTSIRTLTYQATSAVTGSMGAIVSRYDIMSTFTDYMELAGVSADKAEESLSRVDQSIRGIPISLDEAAFRLRRYQMYLGDVERATNLTIGLQRALVAGGSSQAMQTNAYTQIDRLLATGKLGQSRQWISLFNGLGVSLKFLRDELALDPTTDMKKIASDLATGKIAAEDFLRALERLAYNDDLNSAIEIYKNTISAWMENIKNAIKRGGAGLLDTLNESLIDNFGKSLTGVLKDVRDTIDGISASMRDFVSGNPELLVSMSEIIAGFREIIGNVDFGQMVSLIVDNLGRLFDIIRQIFNALPEGFLERFVAFATTLAGPLGKIFSAVASGAGVLIGIFKRFEDFDFSMLIDAIVTQVERMARVVEGLLNLLPDGLLADLMAFGLVWGKPLANVISTITGAIASMISSTAMANLAGLTGLASTLQTIASLAIPLAGVASAIGGIFLAFASHYQNLERQSKIDNKEWLGFDPDEVIAQSKASIQAVDKMVEESEKEIQAVGERFDLVRDTVEKIRETNEEIKESDWGTSRQNKAIEEQKQNLEELKELANIDIKYNPDTGLIEEESLVLSLIDDYVNLAEAKAYAEAYGGARSRALQTKIETEAQYTIQERAVKRQQQQVERLQRLWNDWDNRDSLGISPNLPSLDENGNIISTPVTQTPEYLIPEKYRGEGGYERLNSDLVEAKEGLAEMEAQLESQSGAVQTATEYYNELGGAYREAVKAQSELADTDFSVFAEGEEKALSEIDGKLQDIISKYHEFRTAAIEAIDKAVEKFAELESASAVAVSKIISNLESQKKEFSTVADDLELIIQEVMKDGITDGERSVLETILGDPIAYAGEIKGIAAELRQGNVNIVESMFGTDEDVEAAKLRLADAVASAKALLYGGEEAAGLMADNPDMFGGDLATRLFGDFATKVEEFETAMNDIDISGFTGTTEEAKTAYTDLMEVITGSPDAMQQAAAGLNAAASTITFSAAIAQAHALRDAINSIPSTKVVTVATRGFIENGVKTRPYATGGLVDWSPQGTDTVPAMLTPGEYVVKKSAAQMWGPTFLEAVNGMNVGGAFNAMMSRLSSSVTTYHDNHAVVNQYFYGNSGAGHSERRAWRYISRL